MYELREATHADTELLWTIQCETLSEYVAEEFGTDLEEQRTYFDQHFQVLSHQLIIVDDEIVGHWRLRQPDHLRHLR